VGSIHAPDSELALLNARDVFARRPGYMAMWVVPASSIYWKTREEISQDAGETSRVFVDGQPQPYHVFGKFKHAGTHEWIATITAASPAIALSASMHSLSGRRSPLSWCVYPDSAATKSDPSAAGSFFEPALEKTFRMSTDFRTVTAMRSLKDSPDGSRGQDSK